VDNVLRSTMQKVGRVDILFNNAGIVPTGKLEAIREEQWDRATAINVKSMYRFCHAVIPLMKAGGRGRHTQYRFSNSVACGDGLCVLHRQEGCCDRTYQIDGPRLRARQHAS